MNSTAPKCQSGVCFLGPLLVANLKAGNSLRQRAFAFYLITAFDLGRWAGGSKEVKLGRRRRASRNIRLASTCESGCLILRDHPWKAVQGPHTGRRRRQNWPTGFHLLLEKLHRDLAAAPKVKRWGMKRQKQAGDRTLTSYDVSVKLTHACLPKWQLGQETKKPYKKYLIQIVYKTKFLLSRASFILARKMWEDLTFHN